MTVLVLNGLVGKASVLPSASIRIYVLVETGEKKFDESNDGRWSSNVYLMFIGPCIIAIVEE